MSRRLGFLIAAFALALPVLTSSAQAQTNPPLVPIPREYHPGNGLPLGAGIRIDCEQPCDAQDAFAVADLKSTLATRGIQLTEVLSAPHIFVVRSSSAMGKQIYQEAGSPLPAAAHAEGYAIVPDKDGIALTADTAAGIFYALQTARQLVTGDGASAVLQMATIRDWPAMPIRGLHDDLSRGPVDTLEFQKKIVRTIAAYKANLYSPYFESTQQYASNPLAGVPGASMTAADARELVAYAAQYHVTIVPEQEAFGHLRHMLIWEKYQSMAETPHGAVLAPGEPGSIQLIDGMFKDLATLYPGPYLHIGGDETADLGVGRTRADVDARGIDTVYLEFLQKIVKDLQPLHRKILFWGDIAQNAPEQLKALPQSFKDQTIAVAWGYSPNPRGFEKQIRPFTDAGISVWVSPAINNYRQIWPNQQQALDDIMEFTRDGQQFGAAGQLNTLWDDDGESLANMNWYGILFGAAAGWQAGASSIPAFQQSYAQVFNGDSSGLLNQAQNELTAAMSLLHDNKIGTDSEGTDGLFWLDPWSHDGQNVAAKIRPFLSPLRLHAERAIELIQQARLANPNLREADAIDAMDFGARRIDFLGLKFQACDEMASGYARAQATALAPATRKVRPGVYSLLSDINGVNGRLQDLTYGYSQLRDMYEQEWLRSYRPANLRPVLEHFDYTINIWQARIDKLTAVRHQWGASHTLPGSTDLGIPAPPPGTCCQLEQ
jgi:hexosaminidase